MTAQVKLVGIFMIVNGSLIALFGILLASIGPMLPLMLSLDKSRPQQAEDEFAMKFVLVFYLGVGLVTLVIGILNLTAGMRLLKFRGRVFAIVSLFLTILPIMTCYCALTSLGVLVFGLIVLFNAETARAFALADRGMSPAAIMRRFARRTREYDPTDELE